MKRRLTENTNKVPDMVNAVQGLFAYIKNLFFSLFGKSEANQNQKALAEYTKQWICINSRCGKNMSKPKYKFC